MQKTIVNAEDLYAKFKALPQTEQAKILQEIDEILASKNKDINPIDKLFGIWKDRDINLNDIREKAWRSKK